MRDLTHGYVLNGSDVVHAVVPTPDDSPKDNFIALCGRTMRTVNWFSEPELAWNDERNGTPCKNCLARAAKQNA